MKQIENNRIMIYTFSPYYKNIFSENSTIVVKNEKFGFISKSSTVEITFQRKLSEKMLEYFFQKYYGNNNYNLFIIHFKLKDSKYLNYVKYLKEQFNKTTKVNEKKIFLFVLHIEKNYENEKNMNNEELNNKAVETMEKYHSYLFSYLSEYQQITIDNLLEPREISVTKLYYKTNEELIEINELFDIFFIIKKEFSRQITQMKLFQDKNSILDKLDNLLINGSLECLKKKIKESIKNSDNILRRILMNYSTLVEKDYDFISYFLEMIVKIISEKVEKLSKELWKNGYLISLFEETIPDKLKNSIFSFINIINLLNPSPDDNSDEYLLDLKIPGTKLLFKKISNLVKNCKIDYLNIENEYRSNDTRTKDKNNKNEKKRITLEEIHNEKKQYLKNKLWNEELLTEDIFTEYFNEILKDYFLYNFSDINSKISLNEKQEEFLKFLFSKKFSDDNNSNLDRFFYLCLWFGSYHETITTFLEIFVKLDKYFKLEQDLEDNFNLIYNDLTLLDLLKEYYELFKKNNQNENKLKVNGIFYGISEALCHSIINVDKISLDNIDLNQFCIELNEIAQIFTHLNSSLQLDIKGHYSLLSISKLIEYYQKNNNKNNENEFKNIVIEFISNIFNEKIHLLNKDISQTKTYLDKQINITNKISNELSSKIFVNKLIQYYKNEEYKYELVKTLFKFPHLIKFSSLFFNYIFIDLGIKPKRQRKKIISEDDKKRYIDEFGKLNFLEKNKIIIQINNQAENNEILKEIILYIFEQNIMLYMQGCRDSKMIKDNGKNLILIGLNLDYFQKAYTKIQTYDYGKLNNLEMIFCFAFIRVYLYYFVNLQLEFKELGNLNPLHQKLYGISNSEMGKMINLYIAKIFILKNKEKFFLEEYLEEQTENNWKYSIKSFNRKNVIFPNEDYENFKHLLFHIWTNINNNNKEFVKNLEIIDLYYIINYSFNEINLKNDKEILSSSKLLVKLNEVKDELNLSCEIKRKVNKLLEKISNINFFKDKEIKGNLKFLFNMIRLYFIGFLGYNNNSLFSLLLADKIDYLIKLFYCDITKEEMIFIESYYQINKYFEEELFAKNNLYAVYVCSCGQWYKIKVPFQPEIKECKCGLKMNMLNQILSEKENSFVIYYNEKKCENCELKKMLLSDFKNEFVLKKIINKCNKLDKLLKYDYDLNDETFPEIFFKYIFLSNYYIEYKIGLVTEEEKKNEFTNTDLLKNIIDLDEKMENYIKTKNLDYDDFFEYSCDFIFNSFKNNDYMKDKNKLLQELNNFISKLNKNNDIIKGSLTFKRIEMNILASLTFEDDFKNENLKYLLTASQYPNLEQLKNCISSYKKKPLPILNTFISLDPKNSDIEKLSHLETINDFINSFAEENRNLISRRLAENDSIKVYLKKKEDISNNNKKEESLLEKQFKTFCIAYEELKDLDNSFPLNLTEESPVKHILNDDKIKNNESTINKIYSHLIEIQNKLLNKIIEDYNREKNEIKEDIIINNAIEQIRKEKPIQSCTKADIFSFNVSNNVILSFEELFSFYSLKNIFNKKSDKIDYTKYSEIKFKFNMIEKELVNIILTGKKLFSKKQITYKFYSDPYEVEEKTKKFEKFTEIYGRENLNDEEEINLTKQIEKLKKIILPNLEILIFYLIQENKYQGTQPINTIKFHHNLYLDEDFIKLFQSSNIFTINKLISIYELAEDKQWYFFAQRYVNEEFKSKDYYEKNKKQIDEFYENESERELKNDMIASLLIKFVCRYLPYEPKESETKDLFKMILEKNMNLPDKIQSELLDMKNKFGVQLKNSIDITRYFYRKREEKKIKLDNEKEQKQKEDDKKEPDDKNDEIINQQEIKEDEEESDEDSEEQKKSRF